MAEGGREEDRVRALKHQPESAPGTLALQKGLVARTHGGAWPAGLPWKKSARLGGWVGLTAVSGPCVPPGDGNEGAGLVDRGSIR